MDIGTNSVLLSVCELKGREPIVLYEGAVTTRLGEGLLESGSLKTEAMNRTIEAVKSYLKICDRLKVERIKVIGTSAIREADNSDRFVSMIERLGLELRIISGDEEAYLSFISVAMDSSITPPLSAPFAVVDVGGGSTELIIGEGRRMIFHRSFPLGAVKLTERFLRTDPPKEEELEEMIEFVREGIDVELYGVRVMVGIGGTITTLAAVKLELLKFDPLAVHGLKFSYDEVSRVCRRVWGVSLEDRRKLKGLDPTRADIIVAGTAIVRTVMEKLGAEELIVSYKGVRYGVIYEHLIHLT